MATKYGQLAIPTPQDVMRKIQAERQALLASGQVAAMNQAIQGNALDALFGNKEIRRAEAIQSRVNAAMAGVQAQEGDDDVTAEMRRLAAVRDAVGDLDPNLAAQVQTQLMQLGTIKLERDKLLAQTNSAQAAALKHVAQADKAGVDAAATVAQEGRAEQLFPGQLEAQSANIEQSRASAAASRASAAETGAKRTNWMNPKTGEMVSVQNTDARTKAGLAAAGWVEAGNPQLQGSKEDLFGLSDKDRSAEVKKFRELATAGAGLANQLAQGVALIDRNPNAATLPGEIASVANGLKQNLLATFMANGVQKPDITKEGANVEDIVGNSLPGANQQMKGMVTAMVYAQARANDPGGRLSNQDVEMVAKQFGQLNPQQLRNTMLRLMLDTERTVNVAGRALAIPDDDSAFVTVRQEFDKAKKAVSPKPAAQKPLFTAPNGARVLREIPQQ